MGGEREDKGRGWITDSKAQSDKKLTHSGVPQYNGTTTVHNNILYTV